MATVVAQAGGTRRKKKTEVVEPQVIDEDLLRQGVLEPLLLTRELTEPIDFPFVTSLALSFHNILHIDNLQTFTRLKLLRLDNNIIEEIKNLDHLVNLTWLDLSFNNIAKIQGLDNLCNLTDLSLYSNRITKVEGLSSCRKLNVLSLGRNHITELKQVDSLRSFSGLRCLCLEGNPICKEEHYQSHVLAFLSHLKYLDYMLVDKKKIAAALETSQDDELRELREKEAAQLAAKEADTEKQKILAELRESFVDGTEGLFEDMFDKSVEPEAMQILRDYLELKTNFKEKLQELVKILRDSLIEKNELRLQKVRKFEAAVKKAEEDSEQDAKQLLKGFQTLKKKVLREVNDEPISAEESVNHLLDDLDDLHQHLMTNETMLQETLEEALDEFEVVIREYCKYLSEKGSDFFRQLEELEKKFATSITEGVSSELELYQANPDDADPRKARFLSSREELMASVTAFNEHHIQLIQFRDEDMQKQITAWMEGLFEQHRQRQYSRNRVRLQEVQQVVEEYKEEITDVLRQFESDEEDDD
ncbi:unnamed protein product [Vitrella brassicaformis CCMP3155]|uniref:Dynein regulatory complex subunit 3 n=2 Tax=Vitrella brassicaformis TaxID=1169539 RepID=A0A0G4F9Y1_VITBC|nr:unnamed protein product [Vitrella brassicaformis CCMP3155]|mmetsp:Transcript_14625/g.34889  ORF Transcript_14625/g.34889 Transcript_14625/m.34889 type:complete len:532 (+) Transcript_14625:77-1672(+)|eukprot:CEM09070.1 unnamed protein product [Vitrella brassicaformis CCMP3155]